jgi:hypothetical protein
MPAVYGFVFGFIGINYIDRLYMSSFIIRSSHAQLLTCLTLSRVCGCYKYKGLSLPSPELHQPQLLRRISDPVIVLDEDNDDNIHCANFESNGEFKFREYRQHWEDFETVCGFSPIQER